MKKFLFIATVFSCLSSVVAAQSALPSTCASPSFRAAPALVVGTEVTAATLADMNNDGRPDLVATDASASAVAILLGGAQGFAPPAKFLVNGFRPFHVTAADFNKDGKLDVVVANPGSHDLSVMLGDGAGGLSTPSRIDPGGTAFHVATADFNGDGNTDLAIACVDNDGTLKVTLGDGAGNFGPLTSYAVGSRARAVVAADFNFDGRVDLAVANDWSHNVSVLLGDGAGGFGAHTQFDTGQYPQGIAAADFNGDGRVDLAVASSGDAAVSILFGAGDGGFGPPTNYPAGSSATSVVVGDFNNDGNADFAAGTGASGLSVRLGDGAGNFGAAKAVGAAFGALSLAAGDYNLDGSDDLVAGGLQSGTLIPLAGDGAGNFAATPRVALGNMNVISTALADFNRDGKLDSVMANENANSVSVRLGDGAGLFGDAASFDTGTRPYSVAVGDFNNDSKADVVTANYLSASITVLLGDGAGGFGAPASVNFGSGYPYFVTVGDVNNDHKDDVLLIRDNTFAVAVLLGNGAGGFASPAGFDTAPNPRALTLGDFNNDSKPDLAVTDNSYSILLGDGAGGFGPKMNTNFGENTGPKGIVAGDFNKDGKLDLALANEFTNNVSVLIGDGAGHFAPRVNYKVGRRPYSVVAADFNGDGKLDLATGNFDSDSISVLLGDGAGAFGQPFDWALPMNPNFINVGDLDGDGKADIVAGGFGNLASLVNTCGQDSTQPTARLSASDVTVTEPDSGTTNATFSVSLAAASAQTVTVKYVASAAGARRGTDFQPASGTLTFAPGVTTQTVAVAVSGDTTDEFDETFTLNLFEPTGALIAKRRGVATIADNDLPPSLGVSNASAPEGQTTSAFAVPVTLSQTSGKLITFSYATADGTAIAGSDYLSAGGTVSVPAGTQPGAINVQVVGDTMNEPDETFFVNLSNPFDASVAAAKATVTLVNDDTPKVQFGVATFVAPEGGAADVVVTRTGETTFDSTVNYATSDGTASARQDYTPALGTLRFGPGETSKTVRVIVSDDRYNDDGESFNVTLSAPTGAELGVQTSATVNITDNDTADGPSPVGDAAFDTEFFVRQHYADFLSREPDAAGLAFWKNEIESCGANAQCREVRKINVSGAFFLSIEFQETGYLAYRTYKAAYGDATSPGVAGTVPVIRLSEFLPDAQRIGRGLIVGQAGWEQLLDSNKTAYALEFVQRQRFADAFPSTLTPAQFVDKLNTNAGGVLDSAERTNLVNELTADNTNAGRASVLRKIAEDSDLRNNEKNRAFVLMQYYGYMRRNPDDPQDTDFRGWKFWLDKLNQFDGNYVAAEMVKAFLQSDEYRKRFGQ